VSREVMLWGTVPVTVVVDLVTGSVVRANVHKDDVRWDRSAVHTGSYRNVVAGNQTQAELIAMHDTWNLILERDPSDLHHDRRKEDL
jgi:nitroimidazol reductase NimA-like FMN-containing flavoprotein (pyridoxamine 5'-phosphate oxidase superfamily)